MTEPSRLILATKFPMLAVRWGNCSKLLSVVAFLVCVSGDFEELWSTSSGDFQSSRALHANWWENNCSCRLFRLSLLLTSENHFIQKCTWKSLLPDLSCEATCSVIVETPVEGNIILTDIVKIIVQDSIEHLSCSFYINVLNMHCCRWLGRYWWHIRRLIGKCFPVSSNSFNRLFSLNDDDSFVLTQHPIRFFDCTFNLWWPSDTFRRVNKHIVACLYSTTILAMTPVKIRSEAFLIALKRSASTVEWKL